MLMSFNCRVGSRVFLLLFVLLVPKFSSQTAPMTNYKNVEGPLGSKISDGCEVQWRVAGVCAVEPASGCSRMALHCLSKSPKYRRIRNAQGLMTEREH